jgi:hypothetical protein
MQLQRARSRPCSGGQRRKVQLRAIGLRTSGVKVVESGSFSCKGTTRKVNEDRISIFQVERALAGANRLLWVLRLLRVGYSAIYGAQDGSGNGIRTIAQVGPNAMLATQRANQGL